MALTNVDSLFFFVLISSCCMVSALKVECNSTQYESCSKDLVRLAEEKDVCHLRPENVTDCLEKLPCSLMEKQMSAMNDALIKLKQSLVGCCKNEAEICQTRALAVDNVCRRVEYFESCLEDAPDCQDESSKTIVEELTMDFNKNNTGVECCNYKDARPCVVGIELLDNETASDDHCMKVNENKKCIEKFLETCKEDSLIEVSEKALNISQISLKVCESKGYKIDDGGNGGLAVQPIVALLFVSLLGIYSFRHMMI